jgi:hypothetical protein
VSSLRNEAVPSWSPSSSSGAALRHLPGFEDVARVAEDPSISANGRFVTFESDAPNLVKGDTNGGEGDFVRDRIAKKTRRVSVKTGDGQSKNGFSSDGAISGDGKFVAFESDADNLVKNDTDGFQDIFRRGPLR